MRRWRLLDGRTLAEAPLVGKVQYHLLGRDGKIDRVYAESSSSVQEELHRMSFVVLGRQLMCRHIVERGFNPPQDNSRIEIDGLTQLTAEESPTTAEVLKAIAMAGADERELEKGRQARIDRLAESAGPGARPLLRRLAERIVRHDDQLAVAMVSTLRSLAELQRSRPGSRRAATEAIALAGRLVALERGVPEPTPVSADQATRALIDALDALRDRLRSAAEAQDAVSDSVAGSEAGRAYRKAAEALRVAIHHLLIDGRDGE